MINFWLKLKKPFWVLAPMADVTDIAFRQIIAEYSRHGKRNGGPDVFYTEFISADGLASVKGRKNLIKNLKFSEQEKPIVAQIFGAKPENIFKAAQVIGKLGFSGIDLNMGCPDKKVEKQGAGAALIKNPQLAKELIQAAREGGSGLGVSVKTRLGYNTNIALDWCGFLLSQKPDALTIHARTRKELSAVPANWQAIKEIVELRDQLKSKTIIIGNGDIQNLKDGEDKANFSGVDGLMVGRGIFGNPWFFNKNKIKITQEEKFEALIKHAQLFEKLLVKKKNKGFAVMKKHFKSYLAGFNGAKELRDKLMHAQNAKEVKKIILNSIKSIK